MDSENVVTRGKIDSIIAARYDRLATERSAAGSNVLERLSSRRHLCSRFVNCSRSRVTRLEFVARSSASICSFLVTARGAADGDTRQWTADMAHLKATKEVPKLVTLPPSIAGRRVTLLISSLAREAMVVGRQGQDSTGP